MKRKGRASEKGEEKSGKKKNGGAYPSFFFHSRRARTPIRHHHAIQTPTRHCPFFNCIRIRSGGVASVRPRRPGGPEPWRPGFTIAFDSRHGRGGHGAPGPAVRGPQYVAKHFQHAPGPGWRAGARPGGRARTGFPPRGRSRIFSPPAAHPAPAHAAPAGSATHVRVRPVHLPVRATRPGDGDALAAPLRRRRHAIRPGRRRCCGHGRRRGVAAAAVLCVLPAAVRPDAARV